MLRSLQHAPRMLEKIQQRGAAMAFWSKKVAEFEKTDQVLNANPGIIPAELARKLDTHRSTILRRLPSMEEAGYLYSEDKRGRLWPFRKKR